MKYPRGLPSVSGGFYQPVNPGFGTGLGFRDYVWGLYGFWDCGSDITPTKGK